MPVYGCGTLNSCWNPSFCLFCHMCRAHLLSVPMQAPDKELQELSQRQLTALKQHAAAQVIKLQQAIESLNQSAIQHSLKPTHADIGSSAPAYLNSNEEGVLSSTDVGLPPALFIDNSFAHASFRPATPTTKERLQDTKQYIGAIALMLHDFQQQRDAAVSELQRRAEEKRRMVAQVQSQSALDLDQQVSKDVKRHLQNAQVSQYEQLMAIQETNRRHHNKVSSIRRMVEQQRSDSVADMIARDDKEQAREAARQAHLQAQAEERRRRNDAKEAKLAAKLAQFDRSRMQALESAPRVEGDFVKDLLQHGKQMTKDIACKKQPVGKAHRSAPVPDDDPFSPGVLERLTKLPPRGIDLKKDLDTSMSNHVAQVARSKHYLVSEVHDRLERREKAHDKNFNELYKKKEDRWAAQKREEDEEQRRILSLKNAQKEQLDRLSQQREEQRRFAARRAASHTTTGLVDHWAARARLLIESACRAAMTPEPGDIGGQNRKMDPKSLKAGFEQTAHKR